MVMVKFECPSSVLVSASFGMLHFFTLSEGTLQEDHCQAVFTGAWVCVCMRECVCGCFNIHGLLPFVDETP